ncbi:MAG: class I SAM-dependent methyltransferase [Myxococcales bacterium]|nr:class I SAM-dependent methyltransferase [Myxococcales bacterium]MCB9521012.1 class I SAM-dependent methyltransferase [Myxococcales bacterium]MCB9531661.1 class I SAM-dependent methyltransferase [Myxococcales bacterium]
MLANRVAKNARHRRRWARRAGTDAYRLYDHDIPEIPLAIDVYGQYAVVYDARRDDERDAGDADLDDADQDEAAAAQNGSDPWIEAMVGAVVGGADLLPGAVVVKTRRRQRGADQYERGAAGIPVVVSEAGLRFHVDLGPYLDTGLFLDHRPLRTRFGREAAGRRTLNLFAYTGAFSVHAAAGGAAHTTTVDLSRTYLDWFGENLVLNGLDGPRHERIRADSFDALRELAAARERFDLIVVDPPTFSNSKRMSGTFDVQRDHTALLRLVLSVAAPGATVYFSTNRRKFSLDSAVEELARVDEITAATIDEDFSQRRPHRCWRLLPRVGDAIADFL